MYVVDKLMYILPNMLDVASGASHLKGLSKDVAIILPACCILLTVNRAALMLILNAGYDAFQSTELFPTCSRGTESNRLSRQHAKGPCSHTAHSHYNPGSKDSFANDSAKTKVFLSQWYLLID